MSGDNDMTLLEEIMEYLENEIDDLGIGDNLHMSPLPSAPDLCAAVRPTGGFEASLKFPYDLPTFQVMTRSDSDRRTGMRLAQEVYDALHNFRNGTLVTDGRHIIEITGIQSGPNAVGHDDNDRERFSCNFLVNYVNTDNNHRE